MANQEIARRRTFAIIAHPDAGKTSLTEKLLLFGGQIQVAGAVKGKTFRKSEGMTGLFCGDFFVAVLSGAP